MKTIVVVDGIGTGLDVAPVRPLELAAAVASTGAEALLCSVGLARAIRDDGSRQPLAVTVLTSEAGGRGGLLVSADALAHLGLWALVVPMTVPAPSEPPRLRALCEVVDFVLRAGDGAPLVLVELSAASPEIGDRARGVRLACESGADAVMVTGVASIADVEAVLEHAFRPVYLSDAFGRANPSEYTHLLKRAAALGVAGVVTGPKLLRGRRPTDVAAAIAALLAT